MLARGASRAIAIAIETPRSCKLETKSEARIEIRKIWKSTFCGGFNVCSLGKMTYEWVNLPVFLRKYTFNRPFLLPQNLL